jgi:RNA 2',3'-cyclic 3'-phosphodiesterase
VNVERPERWRLFVAVEVPELVRAELAPAVEPLRTTWPAARWVDPAKWHLTLQFLGSVDVAAIGDVESAVAVAAADADGPFPLVLTGRAGQFGGRVAWAGLERSAPLVALASAVRRELASRGLPSDERPFRAHLTLARAAGRERLPQELVAQDLPAWSGPPASWQVDDVVLMRSRLRRGGALYTVAGRWPLTRA